MMAPPDGGRDDGRKDAHADWEAADEDSAGWAAAEREREEKLFALRIAQAQLDEDRRTLQFEEHVHLACGAVQVRAQAEFDRGMSCAAPQLTPAQPLKPACHQALQQAPQDLALQPQVEVCPSLSFALLLSFLRPGLCIPC